jgi:hypothetical protein
MPAGSSPPCASQGELLDDEAASTAGNRKRRRKPRVRVPVAAVHGARRLRLGWRRVGGPGGGRRLIKARNPALASGPRGGCCRARTPRRRRGRVRVGDDPSSGMTSGTHGLATQGAGGGSGCDGKWAGLGRNLKRLLVLGGCGAGLQGGLGRLLGWAAGRG